MKWFICDVMFFSKNCFTEWVLDWLHDTIFKSSLPMVFLGKGVLKICGKFTGEYPCRLYSTQLYSTLAALLN